MQTEVPKELQELLPHSLLVCCEDLAVPKGNYLFMAGDKPERMFFVVHGEVVLERAGLQGNTVILQRTRRGFVSEASLQSPKYHCYGQAVGNTHVVQIPIRLVRQAIDTDAAFAGRWIGMLNQEVKRLRLQCERLSLSKVQDRFAHLLETEGADGCFPLGSGVKSLAPELGVSHEALYRCISAMEKQGLLTRTETHFCLASAADIRRRS
jgi:CRP-like cAMP-binding protein